MKTDLLLIPMSARWADMRAAALVAEEAGFDGLWTWDHLRDPDDDGGPGVPEAWTVLSALAEVTRRVMLGPLVLNVANRHPGVLANMAATLQTISGGRLLLGLGAGGSRLTPYAVEQATIGQPVERDAVRAQRVVDAIALIRRLWAGEAGFLRPQPAPPHIIVVASDRAWPGSPAGTAMASTRRRCTRSSPISCGERATSTPPPAATRRASSRPSSPGWRSVGSAGTQGRARRSSAPGSTG
jgi:alkanesulfonate monooxygenase SsuD/methylene tetrahydromethanopterin reductase-like flavin-dependent oxidoreductase (luciferase family)